jgi:hypothetical protein
MLGDALQLEFLVSHALPQFTTVERGGSAGSVPPSSSGNGSFGAP